MKRLVILGLVVAFVIPAAADDLNPASWRGSAYAVLAEWDFPTEGDVNPDPCSYDGPSGGDLDTYLFDEEGANWTWHDSYQGRQGVWQIDGDGVWDVANFLPTTGGKHIQVQITYYGDLEGMYTYAEDFIPDWIEETVGLTVDSTQDLENGWTYALLTGEFETFNPSMESYYPYASGGTPPTGGLYVDQIVIETLHYTPEPATMVLLGLGGLMVVRRRR